MSLESEFGPGPEESSEHGLAAASRAAAELYGLEVLGLTPLGGGRVNESFRLESPRGPFVIQRLNDFFRDSPALGFNWQKVYQAAADKSGLTPPPIPPIYGDFQGRLVSRLPGGGGSWRLTGFLDGRAAPKTPATARAAARLLGRVHRWLNRPLPLDLLPLPEGEFTNQHLPRPEEFKSLEAVYRGHPHLPELRPLIGRAIEAAWQLPLFPGFGTAFRLRDVVIHGDCKAENFLFDSGGRAVGLLDWDSVGYGHILVDIAEMLRSWGHDEVALANAEAVLSGYAETGLPLQDDDLDLLPPVLRAIVLNLARRYLTDALAEVYFKWDREAYPSLFLQNRARAEKMLNLADYLLDHEPLWAETLKRGYRQASRLFPDEN